MISRTAGSSSTTRMVSSPPRNSAASSAGAGAAGASLTGRKIFKVGALADLARDFDPAVVLRDDAVNRGEAEAGAFADFLGGEERLEDVAERLGVHAAAGVGEG